MPKVSRRPLSQPHTPLHGSTDDRKFDVGFVEDSTAKEDSKYNWSQILVPGELKKNPKADISKTWSGLGTYSREILAAQNSRRFVLGFTLWRLLLRLWQFDRLGSVASLQVDIHDEPLKFVTTVLAFLYMIKEQFGFDPTAVSAQGQRYIEIERDGQKERLILDKVIRRARCIAGRAMTCWRAHRDGDDTKAPIIIKDSWQYPERGEEGELLREATERGVVNVARYYYHKTVHVNDKADDISSNVRSGLDITKATKYRAHIVDIHTTRNFQSSTTIRRKRVFSQTNAPMPPKKRSCSSSPTHLGKSSGAYNRVHRRVILRDFGKPIITASSKVALLATMEKCIEGYESLYTKVGMLQCDISPGNLMINEGKSNPS